MIPANAGTPAHRGQLGRVSFTMNRRRQATASAGIESLLAGMESGPRLRESLALAYWARVAGAQAAKATEAMSVRDGILFIRTRSAVWSHELSLHKTHLRADLNRLIGRPVIREIIFKAEGIEHNDEVAIVPELTNEEIAQVQLSHAEEARLNEDLAALDTVRDDALRASLARLTVREARLRHKHIELGWKECSRCTALHKEPGSTCPVCSIRKI